MMHVYDYLLNENEREYFKIHSEGGMIDFEEPSEEDEGENNVDEDVSTIYESVRNRPQSTPKKSAKQNKRQPPVIEDTDSEVEFTAPPSKNAKTAKLADKETTPKKRRLYNAVSLHISNEISEFFFLLMRFYVKSTLQKFAMIDFTKKL